MSSPLPLSPGPAQRPIAAPVAPFTLELSPSAARSYNHVAGYGVGSVGVLADLWAYFWYVAGGGFDTRGAHKGQMRRYPTGLEDSSNLKRGEGPGGAPGPLYPSAILYPSGTLYPRP